ncbi:hypothetical protein EAN55_15515 [Escherichia albertii]|nr:hypothetical protein [Escherichia albertii]
MKRIVIINGSPKKTASATDKLASEMQVLLPTEYVCHTVNALQLSVSRGAAHTEGGYQQICRADVLLFIFPVYADALPASLLQMMHQITPPASPAPPQVYAITQCGFYESEHTRTALRIMAHFCAQYGFCWQGGMGIGGGAMIKSEKSLAKPPTQNIHHALCALARRIVAGENEVHIDFITPSVPRWLYRMMGSQAWLPAARRHGVLRQLILSYWKKPEHH